MGKAAKVHFSTDIYSACITKKDPFYGFCSFVPVLFELQEYPFVLDPFQREAILCIDNNESVLVSAHTSAGKTVCAE